MLFLQNPCLIMLIVTVTLSIGNFGLGQNVKGKTNRHKIQKLGTSFQYLQPKSENGHLRLETKSKRSRRSTGDGVQMPENTVCPGCSNSYTPYFSGQCFLCPAGIPGPRGPPGQQGIPGRDGRDGRDTMNERGDVGLIDTPELRTDSTMNRNSNTNTSGGAVYVRWGRSECSPLSELIYHGIAGGSHYTHKGSGSNYLCMPEEPIYDEPVVGTSSQDRGYIYGAEYETNNFANWHDLHNNNVYCAVCWAPGRPSLMMIPARNICPGSEWTKEYSGYLVSEFYNHGGRTEYVCMDRNAEAVPRTAHNANGALFYAVEGRCGSSGSGLPCGPYVDGYELTCAVCTR